MARKPTKAKILEIFRRLHDANPEPKSDLEWTNTYTLLVAVALSAQATDKGVNKATKALFEKISTPQQMLDLGLDGLISYIKTIGLYNSKAKNIMAAAHILVTEYGGEVPNDHTALTKLPGVGNKTANVVMNIAFGHNTLAVDTHVFRLSHRLGFSTGNNPDAVERDLMKIVPEGYARHAHHWLILHGRYVCTARNPKCHECILNDLCPSAFKV